MKIPESVRIAGVEYPVEYTDHLNNGSQLAYGHIDFEKCKIELTNTIPLNHQKKCIVLLHEILHGIVNDNGMDLENEEEVVEMFARGIYQLLQDNGKRFFDLKEPSAEEFIDKVLKEW